jgi:hypothetical protein
LKVVLFVGLLLLIDVVAVNDFSDVVSSVVSCTVGVDFGDVVSFASFVVVCGVAGDDGFGVVFPTVSRVSGWFVVVWRANT